MRSRQEIWNGFNSDTVERDFIVDVLEVLLDIRELLQNPPKEITGVPNQITTYE